MRVRRTATVGRTRVKVRLFVGRSLDHYDTATTAATHYGIDLTLAVTREHGPERTAGVRGDG